MLNFKTSLGSFSVELDGKEAPISVENFLAYVDSGHFAGTVFHRVIPGFVIQGGGLTADMRAKPTRSPIKNEAANGLKNKRGTLSMARTNDIHSATSQFFVNLTDNASLDQRPGSFGYAVFGRVVKGMDVVDAIAKVKTGSKGHHDDVPLEPVVLESVTRSEG
jgi:cyclophilin family peptidyl-prolyl cis-trans isomerase